jgi:hypothetical protein
LLRQLNLRGRVSCLHCSFPACQKPYAQFDGL